ncbi:HEPN/Toprim-associated domain-containing protein [Niabella sp. CJ426]|uniref:HEPN/Toprim-associated domain-containing protein n=1 Tax=Niabella sp. CJ426 TaxID=3393740 RepID=UPI003D00B8F5
MGSYSELYISGYPTFPIKNSYNLQIVNHLFQPEDYISERRKYKTKNRLTWGDSYVNSRGTFIFKGFRQTVGVCKSRLAIFGMNIRAARTNFMDARKIAGENQYYNQEYDFSISKVSFKDYYLELKSIINNKAIDYTGDRNSLQTALITDGLYVAGQSIPAALYSILSCVNDDAIVEYDLSDVIDGGWVKPKVADNITSEKIIILTEGKTDAIFIKKSLQLLYPHLFPYYHFMDFEGYRVEGGASILVKTLKVFAASNVKHPIIALFDNDTAGIAEMKKIPAKLPNNIKALKMPDINLAKKYPTIGPEGSKQMNVNGLACSIELYLGKEILSKNGYLSKIKLISFDNSHGTYQGVLENKGEVQKIFTKRMKRQEYWEMPEMKKLLEHIFRAFDK